MCLMKEKKTTTTKRHKKRRGWRNRGGKAYAYSDIETDTKAKMIQTTVKVFLILANNYKTKFGDRRVLDTRKKKEEEQEERTNQTKIK